MLIAEGMDFSIPPSFLVEYGHSVIIRHLQEMDQKILPCGQRSIDSVKINLPLLIMRECCTLTEKVLLQSQKGVGLGIFR